MEISVYGRHVTGEQSDLGPYCLQYKLHKDINGKLRKNINRLGKQTISGLITVHLKKKFNNANCITVILI